MKIFTEADYNILPKKDFRLYLDFENVEFPDKESENGKKLIQKADELMEEDIPTLYLSAYRLFSVNGDRNYYEDRYSKRRFMLKYLVLGELVQNENKYTDKIIDVLWSILEESTWIIPAHNWDRDDNLTIEMPEYIEEDIYFIDLFSAETAALLSIVYYFIGDKLPDIVNNKIIKMIKQRVLIPYLKYDNMFWMGFVKRGWKGVNNWCPWINSNILLSMAIAEEDDSIRKRVFDRALACIDNYINTLDEDGGCDEGPVYWGVAAGSVFDCLEIIYDLTDGRADYFNEPFIKNMFDYIRKIHITGNYFAAFSDSTPTLYPGGFPLGIRMGKRIEDSLFEKFAESVPGYDIITSSERNNYREFKNTCFNTGRSGNYTPARFDLFEKLQVALIRKNNCIVVAKGGHNNENHNHNDVGNIIVFVNDKPLIIDIGRPTYRGDVFNEKRWTVFPIGSKWHNLPVINGFEQKNGPEFTADSFEADENFIRVEYQNAYEKESGAKKCVREISVSDTEIILHESVECNGGGILFNYFFLSKPLKNDNVLEFKNGARIVCPDNCKCSIIELLLTDEHVSENWSTDKIYQLTVESTDDKKADFEIKILK